MAGAVHWQVTLSSVIAAIRASSGSRSPAIPVRSLSHSFCFVPMLRAVLIIFDAPYATPYPPFVTTHSYPFLDVDRPARTLLARSHISRPRVLSPSVSFSRACTEGESGFFCIRHIP